MMKKFVYIGVILVVVALIILVLSGSLISLKGVLTQANYTVSSGMFSYLSLTLANQSAILLAGSFSGPLNFYLFNSSAFSKWSAAVDSANALPGYQVAQSLKGAGLFFEYRNVTSIIVPYQQGVYNVTPLYSLNVSKGFPAGTYYAVMDNTPGSPSAGHAVNATLLYATQGSTSSNSAVSKFVDEEAALGLAFLILLIAGIIVIIIGFIKKPKMMVQQQQTTAGTVPSQQKTGKNEMSDEQIDKLYKKIKKKSEGSESN